MDKRILIVGIIFLTIAFVLYAIGLFGSISPENKAIELQNDYNKEVFSDNPDNDKLKDINEEIIDVKEDINMYGNIMYSGLMVLIIGLNFCFLALYLPLKKQGNSPLRPSLPRDFQPIREWRPQPPHTREQQEEPFIKNNIEMTNAAYGLSDIAVKPFPAENSITLADLKNNEETVNNIRLWDPRPLLSTYQQIQAIRTYYAFYNVDVDRYKGLGMVYGDEAPLLERDYPVQHLLRFPFDLIRIEYGRVFFEELDP